MILTKKLAVLGLLGLTTGLVTYAAPAPARAAETAQVVKITASKFHFTPDRIVLAKGQPVTLQLTSADRTHGFMVRAFGIDTDIEPGKTTAITITAREGRHLHHDLRSLLRTRPRRDEDDYRG